MTTEPTFVGSGRHAVVDGLVAAFDAVRDGGSARWIVMEAPSGWGKTRVVREFYRRLAAERQGDPAYWPADILGSSNDVDDVAARRKRLIPDVTHTPGSLPTFMWWGVACSLRGGVASAALRHDLGQMQAHAAYLEDAWREVAASTGRWKSGLRDAGIAVADEAAMEAAGTAVEAVLGAAIPGLGLVRWLGERGVAGVRAAAERRDRLAATDRLVASDLVADTAAMITRLAVPGLPLVIAVEDLHDADAGLADLIATLMTSDAAVLVVSTSWPGRTADNPAVAAALAAAGDRVSRLDHRSATPPAPFGPDASLAELTPDALAAIVTHYFPAVDAATLAAIVDRYPNPLTLELFCQLPRVRRRGRDGALRLDPAVVADAPAEIRGLYLELWNDLPETLREALSLAALGIPALIDPAAAAEWNTDLLLAALDDLDWPSLDEIASALRTGSDAYSWARTVSSMLTTFNEADQRDIAATDDSFLFADDRVEVRTAIAAALARFVDGSALSEPVEHAERPGLGLAERHHLADLADVLYAEGFLTDADVFADAVRRSAESVWDDQRELPRIVGLLTRVVAAAPSPDRAARCLVLRGHAHLLAGRLDDALADADVASMSLDTGSTRSDPSFGVASPEPGFGSAGADTDVDPDTRNVAPTPSGRAASADALFRIEVLNLKARSLAALRRADDAVAAYSDVVAGLDRLRGAEHPDTIAARAGLAAALEEAGRADEALSLLRDAVASAERTLDPDDPYALAIRNSLVTTLANRGEWDEALQLFVSLEADCARALGPDHHRSLNVARNTAFTFFSAGRRTEAVSRLRATLPGHERTFGADHPDTFRAQRLLGLALGQSDDPAEVQEAADLLVAMHAREVEVLGWDHPDVQGTRSVIARVALVGGDHDLAIDVLQRYVADAERIHGRPSLPVTSADTELGNALAMAGRHSESVTVLRRAVAEFDGLVAPVSEHAFSVHRTLGWSLAADGDSTGAADALRTAAVIAAELWGPDDERAIGVGHDLDRVVGDVSPDQ